MSSVSPAEAVLRKRPRLHLMLVDSLGILRITSAVGWRHMGVVDSSWALAVFILFESESKFGPHTAIGDSSLQSSLTERFCFLSNICVKWWVSVLNHSHSFWGATFLCRMLCSVPFTSVGISRSFKTNQLPVLFFLICNVYEKFEVYYY